MSKEDRSMVKFFNQTECAHPILWCGLKQYLPSNPYTHAAM